MKRQALRLLAVMFTLAPVSAYGVQVVRVGYLPATHDALLFVAAQQKLFDGSVDVQPRPYENSVQILNDLKSGLLDIGIPGMATPAVEIGGKAPLSIIGGAAVNSAALVVRPKAFATTGWAKMSAKAKLVSLKGKRVGAVRGSTGLAILRQSLAVNKLTENDVELRIFTKPSEIISALQIDELDAGLLWSPHMTLAAEKGLPTYLWMSDLMPDHVCCRQVARDDFLQAHEGAAVEYMVGLLRADKALRQARASGKHLPEIRQAIRAFIPTLTDKEIDIELLGAKPATTVTPDLNARGISSYLDAMVDGSIMHRDQARNVEQKVRGDIVEKAYERLGCSRQVAAECAAGTAATCRCLNEK